jgi:hypothetical protein
MTQPIGNFSSIAPVKALTSQSAPAAQALAAASSQAIQDSLNISQQGKAASAKLDADGDGDGH